jgi:hypothetical protein
VLAEKSEQRRARREKKQKNSSASQVREEQEGKGKQSCFQQLLKKYPATSQEALSNFSISFPAASQEAPSNFSRSIQQLLFVPSFQADRWTFSIQNRPILASWPKAISRAVRSRLTS